MFKGKMYEVWIKPDDEDTWKIHSRHIWLEEAYEEAWGQQTIPTQKVFAREIRYEIEVIDLVKRWGKKHG